MNLLQIRTQFVGKTGRYDLVVSESDLTDNGANFFIQAGQRLLDSILPYRKDVGRYITTILAGQVSVYLKHIRAYESVYITTSSEGRQELGRKAYSWLLEQYGDDYGERAVGTLTFSGVPDPGEGFTVGSETYTFSNSDTSAYTILRGGTVEACIDNLVAKVSRTSDLFFASKYSTTTVLITYKAIGTAGNSVIFTEDSTRLTADGSGVLGGTIQGRVSQLTSGTPIYWAPLISTPHPELSLLNLPGADTHDLFFGLEKFEKDGILFMPPAEQSYTLTIFGYFYSVLESDADASYHSEMYPELLIMASSLVLEAFYRNTTGVQDWLSSIKLFLKGIDHDLVREEMVLSGNQLRG